jgi:hypothetical protein
LTKLLHGTIKIALLKTNASTVITLAIRNRNAALTAMMDSLAFVVTDTSTMLRRLFVDLFALRDASMAIVKSQMSAVAISASSDQIVPFSANATVTPNAQDLINLTSALTVIIFTFI